MLVIFPAVAVSGRNNKAMSHNKPVLVGVVGGLERTGRAGVGGQVAGEKKLYKIFRMPLLW